MLLLPENRVLHPSVFLPAKQLSVLRLLSSKGFDETLRNYRNASHHCTLEHSSDNKTFSWGDQTILNHLLNGKNNLETVLNWTIKLLDFVKSPFCSGFLSAGESISRQKKNLPLTFKEQNPQRSIQELLLNTKISGINGQTTLFFCFRSHARTLWGSFIYQGACSPAWRCYAVSKHVIVSCKGPIIQLQTYQEHLQLPQGWGIF